MPAKIKPLLAAVVAVLLAVSVYTLLESARLPLNGCLYIAPHSGTAAVADLNKLDETRAATYETLRQVTVEGLQSRHSVVWKGTNDVYPYVMNKRLITGAFFTRDALAQKRRVAVLNQAAAFQIFGGADTLGGRISLNGNAYRVAGVIDDGDADNSNIYAPVTLSAEKPGALMAKMDGVSAAHIENDLKQAGVTSDRYDFIDLDGIIRLNRDKTAAALVLAACFALIMLTRRFAGMSLRAYKSIRQRSHTEDLSRVLRNRPGDALRLAMGGALAAASLSAAAYAGARVMETLIKWRSFPHTLSGRGFVSFTNELLSLQRATLRIDILFFAICAALALLLLCECQR